MRRGSSGIEARAVKGAGPRCFDHDVRRVDQGPQGPPIARAGEVEGHLLMTGVQLLEQAGIAPAGAVSSPRSSTLTTVMPLRPNRWAQSGPDHRAEKSTTRGRGDNEGEASPHRWIDHGS